MYLDLWGSRFRDGCSKELGLDPWLELGSGGVGHLLRWLLGCLGLHCHLLGANLREVTKVKLTQLTDSLYLPNMIIISQKLIYLGSKNTP